MLAGFIIGAICGVVGTFTFSILCTTRSKLPFTASSIAPSDSAKCLIAQV